MAKFSSLTLFVIVYLTGYSQMAQKTTFDAISFTPPQSWQQKQNDGSVQLLITDEKTGAYAMAIITKASPSTASPGENFNTQWTAAIKNQIQLDGDPAMQPPSNGNGWQIVTGSAGYTDNAGKGNVTLLSATGGGHTVSVIIMTNTSRYGKDLTTFLNSLELSSLPSPAGAEQVVLTGRIWEGTTFEKFPGAAGTTAFHTGGYSTGQYRFNTDGTYRFVNVRASFYTDTKTLEYESGAWSVNGSQLTIEPQKGQNEEWTKIGKTSNGGSDVSNRAINDSWGKKLKTTPRTLEKYTYTFTIGKNGSFTALILQRSGHTEREGDGNISYYNETSPDKSVSLPAGLK